MSISDGIALLLTCAGLVILIMLIVRLIRGNGRYTYDDYKALFPHLTSGGCVRCHRCGGSSIWMRRKSPSILGSRYVHVCRTCGGSLYESYGR